MHEQAEMCHYALVRLQDAGPSLLETATHCSYLGAACAEQLKVYNRPEDPGVLRVQCWGVLLCCMDAHGIDLPQHRSCCSTEYGLVAGDAES